MSDLSADQARRVALAAQGFGDRRPKGRVDARHLRRVIGRTKQIQIDAVNVLERAHYVPPFSRLGPYASSLVDDLTHRRRELFEAWGHERSLHPVERWPLLKAARMDRTEEMYRRYVKRWEQYRTLLEGVLAEVRERGPLQVNDLADPGARRGPWWGWNEGKSALEWLFREGRVMVSGRRNFEQIYDVTERVLPPEVQSAPVPSADDAIRELTDLAADALGVGTTKDIADYYRLGVKHTKRAIDDLVDAGRLRPASVEGWKPKAYLHADAKRPRRIEAAALLSPFDPVVWNRERTERLFGFHYRIEIYVPKPKRQYGYYVLPFLMDDRLVARVDLKADRKNATLLVHGAWAETGSADEAAHPSGVSDEVAERLGAELRSKADWLGLERIEVGRRGDLAAKVRRVVSSTR